ncbi:MAG: hypothetical protein ACREAW_09625, partial [Nitrososphaera sp.]
ATIISALILLPILIHIMSSPSFTTSTFDSLAPIAEDDIFGNTSGEISMVTQFQTGHGFKRMGSTGVQLDDTSDFVVGKQSMQLATVGDGSPVFTRRIGISPTIDLSEKSLIVWLKVSDVSNTQELRVTVTSDRFQTLRNYWINTMDGKINTPLKDNEWTAVTLGPENIRDFGNPDLSKIDTIQLRVVDNGQGPVSVWFNGLFSTTIDKDSNP